MERWFTVIVFNVDGSNHHSELSDSNRNISVDKLSDFLCGKIEEYHTRVINGPLSEVEPSLTSTAKSAQGASNASEIDGLSKRVTALEVADVSGSPMDATPASSSCRPDSYVGCTSLTPSSSSTTSLPSSLADFNCLLTVSEFNKMAYTQLMGKLKRIANFDGILSRVGEEDYLASYWNADMWQIKKDLTPPGEAPLHKTPLKETTLKETTLDKTTLEKTPPKETPPDKISLDNTPLDKTPPKETPTDKTSLIETSLKQTPLDKIQADKIPLDKTPLDETSLNKTTHDKIPFDKTPLTESPPDKSPLHKTPLKETPLKETPLKESSLDTAPLDKTLPNKTSLDEAPSKEIPLKETSLDTAPLDKTLPDKTSLEETPPKK